MTRPSLEHYRKSLSRAAPEAPRPNAQELHDFHFNPQLIPPERYAHIQAYIEANGLNVHPPPEAKAGP